MSSTVCHMLPFSVLCVPKQLTEEAWEVRWNIQAPQSYSAKQSGAQIMRTALRSAP